MSEFRHVRIEGDDVVRRIVLARPDVHNAFNAELISDLTRALDKLKQIESLRVLVIAAEGSIFCAGADFLWMGGLRDAGYEENLADSRLLFDMFSELYGFPCPTIARVQGGAYGGGCGIVACCDFVVLADDATLAFSEVKIGLVPATISPFVLRKVGEGRTRELFLSGMSISPVHALKIGLANQVVSEAELDAAVTNYTRMLRANGPQAMRLSKEILREVPRLNLHEARDFTALRISEQRMSDEGQEGMTAFLEKRKPQWASS